MEVMITTETIKELLTEAKQQFVDVAIADVSGQWSEKYFRVVEIKEFKTGNGKVIVLLFSSPADAEYTIRDAKAISAFRFNKYLNFQGKVIDEARITTKVHRIQTMI